MGPHQRLHQRLPLTHGMDTMGMDVDGEDTPTVDITDTTEARGPLMLRLNLLLPLKLTLRLMPLLMPGTDITDISDTTDTDGVDIMDTPTPGLTVIITLERDLLNLRPHLRPTLRLRPNPGTMAVGVDTMAILIGVITVMDTAVVTGGKPSQ